MTHTTAYDEDDQDRTPSDFTVLALRTAALGRVSASLEAAREEVARLRAGEDATPCPANTQLTAAQWLYRFNEATADERLAAAERAIFNAEKFHQCFMQNHRGEIGHLRRRVAELEADREEASQFAGERNTELCDLRCEVEGLRSRLAAAEGRPNA